MTHLSLFSGIGGLDLAAEWAGFETVGQCEWADYPTKVLEKHWPNVPRWRDIRTLTRESFYERTGKRTVDIISGGFPCQPFSAAGRRLGTEDDRYLWPEMLRVAEELQPRWFIGENVAGLVSMAEPDGAPVVESRSINRFPDEDYYEAVLSQQERMLLHGILQDLEGIGYQVQTFIIPACAVDAKHRRDRLAIVAYSDRDTGRPWRPQQQGQQRSAGPSSGSYDVAGSMCIRRSGNDRGKYGLEFADSYSDVADAQSLNSRRLSIRAGEKDTGFACGGKNVAYPQSERCHYGDDCPDEWQTAGKINAFTGAGICSGKNVRNVSSAGLSDGASETVGGSKPHTEPKRPNWWPVEPDVGRVAHGISDRVDRLKCLGNAVVPQQFYPIFKAIADIEQG